MSGAAIGLLGWLAIGSAVASAGGASASFAQAGKSKRAQRDAESEADAMMRRARRRLDINYMEQLAIKKEPYELQREAMLQSGATALDAAREGDQRGVAATAGRLQQAQNMAQGQTRAAMSKEQQAIEMAVAKEDSRLRDLNVQLDLGEIEGQQAAAADAQRAASQQMTAGFQQTASALQQGLATVPLFQQNLALQKSALGNLELTPEQMTQIGNVDVGMGEAGSDGFTNLALRDIPGMSNKEFRQFKRGLNTDQTSLLFGNQAYQDQYALGLSANQSQFANTQRDLNDMTDINTTINTDSPFGPPSTSIVEEVQTTNAPIDNAASFARKKELMDKMMFGPLSLEEQQELQLLMSQ